MRTLICAALLVLALAIVLLSIPHAHAFAAAADGSVTVAPLRLDFSPLIPVINGLIVAVAGVVSAAVPVVLGYVVIWLRNHGIQLAQSSQKVISDRVTATIQNGLKYATAKTDDAVSRLTIEVKDEAVAKAANYAIAQSPELLKKAGIDVTTQAGQETLVRRITAEAQPTPPALAPTVNDNRTSQAPEPVKAG